MSFWHFGESHVDRSSKLFPTLTPHIVMTELLDAIVWAPDKESVSTAIFLESSSLSCSVTNLDITEPFTAAFAPDYSSSLRICSNNVSLWSNCCSTALCSAAILLPFFSALLCSLAHQDSLLAGQTSSLVYQLAGIAFLLLLHTILCSLKDDPSNAFYECCKAAKWCSLSGSDPQVTSF